MQNKSQADSNRFISRARKLVILSAGVLLTNALAHGHGDERTSEAERASQSVHSGSNIPGAINLGLTGTRGQTKNIAARHLLEKQQVAMTGTYT